MTIQTSDIATASGFVIIDPEAEAVGEENVKYTFSITLANPIPEDGYFTLKVPDAVGVGSSPTATFDF